MFLLEPLERRTLLSHWTYVTGKTFVGGPDREAVEVVGRNRIVYADDVFYGGSTQLRFDDCRNVVVIGCAFHGAAGTPDPDGQDVQFDRTTGAIIGNVFYASAHSEDLVSIFADRPVKGSVLIAGNAFYGRGLSDSSTSVCLDGPFAPRTLVTDNRITGARCPVTIAGGVDHSVTGNGFSACDGGVYVHSFYGGPFGGFDVRDNRST